MNRCVGYSTYYNLRRQFFCNEVKGYKKLSEQEKVMVVSKGINILR